MKLNERVLELMNTFLRIGSVIVVLVIEMVLIISPVVFLQRSAISVYLNLQLFSVPLIYVMVNKEPRYKLNWVLIIFLIPGGGSSAGSTGVSAGPNMRSASCFLSARRPKRAVMRTSPTKRLWGGIWPGRATRCTKTRERSFSPPARICTSA